MANESVTTEATETENCPAAFTGFDSSIFAAWAEAVADLLSCAAVEQAARSTVANAGGLIYSLVQAVRELEAQEIAQLRTKL